MLAPDWQATLTEIINRFIKPQFGPGKPFRGVRLDDEVCLSATNCLLQTLGPVASFLKGALGPTLIVSSQEMRSQNRIEYRGWAVGAQAPQKCHAHGPSSGQCRLASCPRAHRASGGAKPFWGFVYKLQRTAVHI